MPTPEFTRRHCEPHRLKIRNLYQPDRSSLTYFLPSWNPTASTQMTHYTRYVPYAACYMALSIWKFPVASGWLWIGMRAFDSLCKHLSVAFTHGATSDCNFQARSSFALSSAK